MTVTITLPLPPKELSPNYAPASRGARMGKAAKTKKYRTASKVQVIATVEAGWKPRWKTATIRVQWYHKTMGFPDRSNITNWLKAAEDGLQDAGLIENDSGLTWLPVERYKDAKNPRVVIHISDQ